MSQSIPEKPISVAMMTSPTVFQNHGGLAIQMRETHAALRELGIDAELVNPMDVDLTRFDVIHAFSAINGCQRIIEHAKTIGKVAIGSPLLQPFWTAGYGRRARLIDQVASRLLGWHVKTEYRHLQSFLQKADHLIALGDVERRSIHDAFLVPDAKISVIPNGIPARFFRAGPDLFCREFGIEPGFVLIVGEVSPYKNQLTLANALKDCGRQLVVIGPLNKAPADYVAALQQLPFVHLTGRIDYADPLLSSAYAAAGVFCLPSLSEVMPLSVLEALAGNTPVVMTERHCMDASRFGSCIRYVEPQNASAIRSALEQQFAFAETGECRRVVEDLTWTAVATRIAKVYRDTLAAASHDLNDGRNT